MKQLLFLTLLGLFMCSCNRYSEEETQQFDKIIANYVEENQLQMVKSESGLYYQILEKGSGTTIKPTAIIKTRYTGSLLSGEVFDNQPEPVELTLQKLMHGWREIAYYIHVGGKVKMIVPPQLGYGNRKMGDIPKDAIMIFELEITDAY